MVLEFLMQEFDVGAGQSRAANLQGLGVVKNVLGISWISRRIGQTGDGQDFSGRVKNDPDRDAQFAFGVEFPKLLAAGELRPFDADEYVMGLEDLFDSRIFVILIQEDRVVATK